MAGPSRLEFTQFAQVLGYDIEVGKKMIGTLQNYSCAKSEDVFSRSRAPHTCHHRISDEIHDVISELCNKLSETYHRKAGRRIILHSLSKRMGTLCHKLPVQSRAF